MSLTYPIKSWKRFNPGTFDEEQNKEKKQRAPIGEMRNPNPVPDQKSDRSKRKTNLVTRAAFKMIVVIPAVATNVESSNKPAFVPITCRAAGNR